MSIEVLIFEIETERFGVRSADVVEVLRAASVSPLPQAPCRIEGALNLRGRVVPVLNTREILGLPPKQMQHTDHLIVVQAGGHLMTLRADRAIRLIRVESDATDAVQSEAHAHLIEFVAKTSDGLVHVLDPRRLLADGELVSLTQALTERAATEVAP
jgi:purine-binding chemotaxis protein CheW